MYIVLIVSTLHRLTLGVYRRAGTDRNFTDLNAADADVRDQWAPRPQEPTLAASTDFNPYRLQRWRWRWPTAAQSSVTRQRTTAHHRPSTIASPSCQPHNISIYVLRHNIIIFYYTFAVENRLEYITYTLI